jgi:RecG-like helicase
LVTGQLQTTRGEVVAVDYVTGRVARFEATLDDGTGKLALAWFNSAFLRRQIHPGDQLQVQGTVKLFRNLPQMAQAKWQKIRAMKRWSPTRDFGRFIRRRQN